MKRFFLLFNLVFILNSEAQTISGQFTQLINQEIKLEGFNGLNTYVIAQTKTNNNGEFSLKFKASDYGVGFIKSMNNQTLFVILSNEDVVIKGESISIKEKIKIEKGSENKWFEQYAKEHPKREQALSAWIYLEKLYANDSLFDAHQTAKKAITSEKKYLINKDENFINNLPKSSYVYWYLPIRKLISSVSVIAQHRPEEVATTIEAFRKINYSDKRLYKSGLYKDAIESHFWLLENSGKNLEEVYSEMKISIDKLLLSMTNQEAIFNETTNYLFDLLERHSLFEASEYLALKVLNETSCTINQDLAKQLETYRAMKKGNIAADILLNDFSFRNGNKQTQYKKLSEIPSKYTLVVFGASWCPKCNEELPKLAQLYPKWNNQGVEIVYVSLDTDSATFAENTQKYPFISYCDYKKWESSVASDYYVFATPTLFLLDNKRKILLRPNSSSQMDAWVDWFLVQGNPMPE